MQSTWIRKIVLVVLVGGLCLVGYALAQAKPPSEQRFKVLSKDPAWVLDKTTGLQWQKAPNSEPMIKANADAHCSSLGDGARLPEIKELLSLVDYSQQNPALPEGHPFQGVSTFFHIYWSATPFVGSPTFFWVVSFLDGRSLWDAVPLTPRPWCVR